MAKTNEIKILSTSPSVNVAGNVSVTNFPSNYPLPTEQYNNLKRPIPQNIGLIPFHRNFMTLEIVSDSSSWAGVMVDRNSVIGIVLSASGMDYPIDITVKFYGTYFGLIGSMPDWTVTIDGTSYSVSTSRVNDIWMVTGLEDAEHTVRIQSGEGDYAVQAIVVDRNKNVTWNIGVGTAYPIADKFAVGTVDYVTSVNTVYTAKVMTKYYGVVTVCSNQDISGTYVRGNYQMGGTFHYSVYMKVNSMTGTYLRAYWYAPTSTSGTADKNLVSRTWVKLDDETEVQEITTTGEYVLKVPAERQACAYWRFEAESDGANITVRLHKH